jgi:hypothetical protein
MSETLTEVDNFDAAVVAPDGDDWMDDAAEVVLRLAQKLVNRTYWLKNHTGKLDAVNTWVANNIFKTAIMRSINADTASLIVERVDVTADFQHAADLEAGPNMGAHVRVYTGSDGGNRGGFVVAFNAIWTKAGGWWQPDQTQPSVALIWRYGDVRLVGKPAATAVAWGSWPAATLTAFGSLMLSEVFRAARMQVTANTNADATNGYRYTAAQSRTSPIPLGSLWGAVMINANGHAQRWLTYPGEPVIWIPLRVPTYCPFQAVRLRLVSEHDSPAGYDVFQLCKRVSTGPWTIVGEGEAPDVPGTFEPDERVVTLHGGSASQIVHDDEEWGYRWTPPIASSAYGNRIMGAEIDWTDIGPNNRVG